MFVDVENTNTRNNYLFIMASISPTVRDSLERELYRVTADSDGATEEFILEDAFKNLIRDLESIGITLLIEYDDFLNDENKLSKFLQLATLLLPSTLYETIKRDSTVRSLIENIVTGSLGYHETTIDIYLTELAGLDGSVPIRPDLQDFIDQLYGSIIQTDIFTQYLINLLDLYSEERPTTISDDSRHTLYRDSIRKIIGKLSDAINLYENDEDFDIIVSHQNYIIRDFISPDNFTPYAYLLLENKDTLPENLISGYTRKWYHYKVGSQWCHEYYTVRKIPVPIPIRKVIGCLAYAFCDTEEDYIAWMTGSGFDHTDIDVSMRRLYNEVA